MDLAPFVNDLQRQLEIAADAGGEEARAMFARLTASLESASRLVLLEALAAAASEITRDLAPGSVEVRLRGRDPEFAVTPAPAGPDFADPSGHAASREAPEIADDGGTSRTTLRLPDHLKQRMEQAAGGEGISVNAWLVRAVAGALGDGGPAPARDRSGRGNLSGGQSYTGWAR
jgi:hypothetical protein